MSFLNEMDIDFMSKYGEECKLPSIAWPSVVILLLGAVLSLYAALTSDISEDIRGFAVAILALWCAMWAMILYVLWKSEREEKTWFLAIVPVAIALVFFILIVLFDFGEY